MNLENAKGCLLRSMTAASTILAIDTRPNLSSYKTKCVNYAPEKAQSIIRIVQPLDERYTY